MIGVNAVVEDRIGGDMEYLEGNGDDIHSFYEKNNTHRYSSQIGYNLSIRDYLHINVKNSVNLFDRDIEQRDYTFSGKQISSFSEITLQNVKENSEWIWGFNVWTDSFEEKHPTLNERDFTSSTFGAFTQNVRELGEKVVLESGLRIERPEVKTKANGNLQDFLFLPRMSLLAKWSDKFSSRVGVGLGYKTPSVFTEKAEEEVFQNVRPINFSKMKTERSVGVNTDINYKTTIGEDWNFSWNQLFFYTKLRNALAFNPDSLAKNIFYFQNASGSINTFGTETNAKIAYRNFNLYLGYTYIHTQDPEGNDLPLTARNRINGVLMYEVEGSLRIGLESFYVGKQKLTSGEITPDYWIVGISAQKKWNKFSLFINFENFTDTRQTRFENINRGTITNPDFMEIYAPLDGFVFNAGFLISL
jgi:iron complex outermembrane receptor protein